MVSQAASANYSLRTDDASEEHVNSITEHATEESDQESSGTGCLLCAATLLCRAASRCNSKDMMCVAINAGWSDLGWYTMSLFLF